jgi:eukaryotic-like serine/threonine-protein kinase
MQPGIGDLISGKYRLVRLIGDGGMGCVFEARHEYLGTNVALKFIHQEITQRPELVARFLQEAHLSASLKSPHIARVTDVDQAADGAAYLVMELLEGKSLHQVLDEQGKLPQDLALDYTLQILAGLSTAHKAGVVHRDLKPDNVFVLPTPHGAVVKLLDFGIAKLKRPDDMQKGALTRPGMMMGTPEYMAPEQAFAADTVDARADIYAVGTMLYEMLSGKRPTTGNDPQQIAALVLGRQVPYLRSVAPHVPDTLAQIIHRAMAPAPTDRWGSAEELRDALTPFCGAMSALGRMAATPAPSGIARTTPSAVSPSPVMPSPVMPSPVMPSPVMPSPVQPTTAAAAAPKPGATQPSGVAQPAWQNAPSGVAPQPAYQAASVQYGGAAVQPPPRRRSPRGFSFILFALLGLAAVGIIVFAVVGLQDDAGGSRTNEQPTAGTVDAQAAPIPTATQTVVIPSTANFSIGPPLQPLVNPTQKPATPAKPGTRADAGPAANPTTTAPTAPTFQLPFPLPSAFPTALPTAFPSSFPISLPGFPAPPAASK